MISEDWIERIVSDDCIVICFNSLAKKEAKLEITSVITSTPYKEVPTPYKATEKTDVSWTQEGDCNTLGKPFILRLQFRHI